ncbi:MAG: hypothetical protein ACK2TT_00155 [Anaerolineales bacterium]
MKKTSYLMLLSTILILGIALAGCGGETPAAPQEPVSSESSTVEGEEVESPFANEAELPTGATVTDLKQIEGTWIAPAYPGNFVLTIFPDGTLSVATSLEDLKAGSTDSWQLVLEDGEITATGYALCLGDVGSYVATLKDDGTLRFTSIIDPCDARIRKMDRSLPGRLNEYILIYHPVE